MHIAEGFLPVAHCIAWSAVSVPFAIHGFRRTARELRADPRRRLTLAASGAFLFTLTALKLPSVAGSSSHPAGVGLAALRCGVPVTTALASIVLVFQALLLAHGGLTTLGANLFSLGIAGPWAFSFALRLAGQRSNWAIGAATVLASLVTYSVTALQLALAFPAPHGGCWAAFLRFGSIFAVSQVPVAVAEALFTVLVVRALEEGEVVSADQ